MTGSIRPELLCILGLAALVVVSPFLTLLGGGKTRGWRIFDILSRVASLAVLSLFAFVFDQGFGVSASWNFCAAWAVVAFTVAAPLPLYQRKCAASAVLGVILAVVITLHFADFSPVKPYLRFHGSIENGMSRNEVLALLHREFPDGGRFALPELWRDEPDGLSFFLDPNQSSYNAWLVEVSLEGGRVVGKDYCPD